MAYVVATTYTTNPRAVVIRKKWIYQYSEAKNLNHGVNRNQLHSIFYSANLEKEPNFDLEKRGFFERELDATYDAKLIRFFDNDLEAIEFKIKHRCFGDGMPPVYNVNRVFEKPLPAIIQGVPHQHEPIADGLRIPNDIAEGHPQHNAMPINPPIDEGTEIGNRIAFDDAQNNDAAMPTNAAQIFEEIEIENDVAVDDDLHNNSTLRAAEDMSDENNCYGDISVIDEVIETIVIDSDDDNYAEPEDSKLNIVPRVKIEDRDRTAIENIMSSGRTSAPQNQATTVDHSGPSCSNAAVAAPQNQTTSPLQQQQQTTEAVPGPSGLNSNARASVNESVRAGSNAILFSKTPPKPRRAKLERDDFSGQIPYAQNEFGDRSYYFKCKTFSISAIFLTLLENMKAKNADEDIMFIKMLLVAFLGSENVTTTKMDKDAEAFIMRIFEVRVKKDKNRKEKFADFLKQAIEDIKNGR